MQSELFAAEPMVAGVSRVVSYIRRLISENKRLTGVRVRGEVSGQNKHGGTLYFSLKENTDVLKCVVWSNVLSRLPAFKDGDDIICAGMFDTYPAHSQYQLVIQEVQLTGTGALFAQFEALRERMRLEGLFNDARKRQLPAFPRKIAVISAPEGRGVEDFFKIMKEGARFVEMRRIDTRVQGEGAEIDIAEAIDKASKLDVDVIVLTRGGGSYEDLFAFNREPVVRAIIRAKHPVLSAIGHERDRHLSDLAADLSCETPSNAAHYFVRIGDRWAVRVERARRELGLGAGRVLKDSLRRFGQAETDLARGARAFAERKANALHVLNRRLDRYAPHRRMQERWARLSGVRSRMDALAPYLVGSRRERLRAARQRTLSLRPFALRDLRQRVEVLNAQIVGANPEAPLDRGYAIVTWNGRAVRNAAGVPIGSEIEAKVQHGSLFSRVERVAP